MRNLIAASGNKGKLKEFKEILGEEFNVLSVNEFLIDFEVEEIYSTMRENSILKAEWVFNRLKERGISGYCVLADDSGLEVDALNGEPGVRSARYSGKGDKANNAKLLKNLAVHKNRDAAFKCCVAFIDEKGNLTTASGSTNGRILKRSSGIDGFGYDPLFYSPELKKSFGKATAEEKNSVSHRYRALIALLQKLNRA